MNFYFICSLQTGHNHSLRNLKVLKAEVLKAYGRAFPCKHLRHPVSGTMFIHPVFLSNGQAYFGPKFPSEGLEGMDTRIPPEINQRDWGTYTFSNGRGVLKMPYGDIPLRMEGNTLIITANNTDHQFCSTAFCGWCKI